MFVNIMLTGSSEIFYCKSFWNDDIACVQEGSSLAVVCPDSPRACLEQRKSMVATCLPLGPLD